MEPDTNHLSAYGKFLRRFEGRGWGGWLLLGEQREGLSQRSGKSSKYRRLAKTSSKSESGANPDRIPLLTVVGKDLVHPMRVEEHVLRRVVADGRSQGEGLP